jgi:hypothetical protein
MTDSTVIIIIIIIIIIILCRPVPDLNDDPELVQVQRLPWRLTMINYCPESFVHKALLCLRIYICSYLC